MQARDRAGGNKRGRARIELRQWVRELPKGGREEVLVRPHRACVHLWAKPSPRLHCLRAEGISSGLH